MFLADLPGFKNPLFLNFKKCFLWPTLLWMRGHDLKSSFDSVSAGVLLWFLDCEKRFPFIFRWRRNCSCSWRICFPDNQPWISVTRTPTWVGCYPFF